MSQEDVAIVRSIYDAFGRGDVRATMGLLTRRWKSSSPSGCRGAGATRELDVYRFPEDGAFAFCREFAAWRRLMLWGYWAPGGDQP